MNAGIKIIISSYANILWSKPRRDRPLQHEIRKAAGYISVNSMLACDNRTEWEVPTLWPMAIYKTTLSMHSQTYTADNTGQHRRHWKVTLQVPHYMWTLVIHINELTRHLMRKMHESENTERNNALTMESWFASCQVGKTSTELASCVSTHIHPSIGCHL